MLTKISFGTRPLLPLVAGLCLLLPQASLVAPSAEGIWPPAVRKIEYISAADKTQQPAMFYSSNSSASRPLLVALHTWSYDYTQADSVPYANWCIENDWVFIHPNFRGTNTRPDATGSELVVGDILSAVEYARSKATIDARRIYLVGSSGGGYASLLMAGRAPKIWAAVSAWVPISNLRDWYFETKDRDLRYAPQIAASCGGIPEKGSRAEDECLKRSATTYLAKARGLPVDINAGIRDGHAPEIPGGVVPISQSLRAYNLLANPADRIPEEQIETLTRSVTVPDHLRFSGTDPLYDNKPVLFRRQSGKVRVTLFDGGHEIISRAALEWLAKQRK